MTNANLPDPKLITRPEALRRLAEDLSRERIIAVDTESNSLYAYQEQVCLIQFSTPQADTLVDPLALPDLSPLAPVFKDEKIEKVFHAAEYDLLCMKRDFGFHFDNLFDTMIAARILGRDAIGLGSMLEKEFGVHADKRYQRANWGQRPLPPDLLSYAQLDTHYLIPLRDRLRRDLVKRGLWDLAAEDFNRARNVNGWSADGKGEDCWRISGVLDLSPRQAAVLLELCRYRDRVARASNRPLFKVLGDNTLIAIASACPTQMEKLKRLPGMTRGQVERHGKGLLEAVKRGLQAKPIEPPRTTKPPEPFLDRLESLRRWRKTAALEMGVNSDVVLPRDLLQTLAEKNPQQPAALETVMKDVPWRLEHFGDQILNVLKKRI